MTRATGVREFSTASLCPTRENTLASSVDIGWTSLLLEHYRLGQEAEGETRGTPDQTIFMLTQGQVELAVRDRGQWQPSLYQVGSAGLTPGRMTSYLRVAAREPATSFAFAYLFMPPRFFAEAVDRYRLAGQPFRDEPLFSYGLLDPTLTHAIFALLRAMEAGMPDLYAETLAQWLATHLLSTHTSWTTPRATERSPEGISDQRLARVVEFMSTHFAEQLSLEQLAREARVSKFHFAWTLRAACWRPPISGSPRSRRRAGTTALRTSARLSSVATSSRQFSSGDGSARRFLRKARTFLRSGERRWRRASAGITSRR